MRSRIGLGTAPLGSQPDGPLWWGPQDDRTSIDTILAAIDAGIDWIDTAPFYGWGRAERLVGQALRLRLDATVRILTKCGTVRRSDGTIAEDGSRRAVLADAGASRDRLGIERVHALQLHDPDPGTPVEETVTVLAELQASGWCDLIGLSNHPVELMARAQAVAPLGVVQHQRSLLCRDAERAGVVAWCQHRAVPFLAWSPLASGFLTDGFSLAALHPDDLRHRLPWARPAEQARLQRVRAALAEVAAGRRCSTTAIALAWAVADDGCCAIVGARTPHEATALAEVPELTPDERQALDRAAIDDREGDHG